MTPGKARAMNPADVKRICHDFAMAGLNAIWEAGPAKPFRFLYMSGSNAVRDPAKRPRILGDYCVMRVSCLLEALRIIMKLGHANQASHLERAPLRTMCLPSPKAMRAFKPASQSQD